MTTLIETPRVICAWCKAVLSEGSEPVSHGICESCDEKHFGGLS